MRREIKYPSLTSLLGWLNLAIGNSGAKFSSLGGAVYRVSQKHCSTFDSMKNNDNMNRLTRNKILSLRF